MPTRLLENAMPLRKALLWSGFWVLLSLAFCAGLYVYQGPESAQLFLAAYTLEKVLSVDNLIVFGAVFTYFGIESKDQRRILNVGLWSAAVLRLIFVLLGVGLLTLLGRPMEAIFALIILWSVWAMLRGADDEAVDHSTRWYIRWTNKVYPATAKPVSTFFHVIEGRRHVTRMLMCLVAIEVTDIMFAFDSVPTVLAITRDPWIVYPAMMLAVCGLRSLYFVIGALQSSLRFLDKAVLVILVGIALKLLAHAIWEVHVDPFVSLSVVLGVLATGVIASLVQTRRQKLMLE
jgi:tellurite resistance protein TerC